MTYKSPFRVGRVYRSVREGLREQVFSCTKTDARRHETTMVRGSDGEEFCLADAFWVNRMNLSEVVEKRQRREPTQPSKWDVMDLL